MQWNGGGGRQFTLRSFILLHNDAPSIANKISAFCTGYMHSSRAAAVAQTLAKPVHGGVLFFPNTSG